ncbi:MAG TPA: hypothetical protein VMI52_05710 [Acetobacteraceae bacterium]|nr:hypothetical protein [Acetobacteraceae bacterium]
MSEETGRQPAAGSEGADAAGEIAALRARAAELEQQLRAATESAAERLIRAELKGEAMRAGMVDLDGLKLVDTAAVRLNDAGEVDGAAALMARLKREKPWLFGGGNSSSVAVAPSEKAPPRNAMQMSHADWMAARTEVLRRR